MKLNPSSTSFPKRAELPPIDGAPQGAAWFWGKDDELGRLNLLTPSRVLAAKDLIKKGEIINLDWRVDLPNPPAFGRQAFKHTISPLGEAGFDDLYELNTQSGSQLTKEEIHNSDRCGMQAWAAHGIAGRGILIDYWAYTKSHYDPLTTHRISLHDVKTIAQEKNILFQPGDILFIRSGFVARYSHLSADERAHLGTLQIPEHTFAGVAQTEEMVDFLHDNWFSAVVGDAPAFEAWPPPQERSLHQYLLPRWGVPIGEMWDLEGLAKKCEEEGRWEFFVTSSPANVHGGVGSHANAVAIF
ncbi:hypothetical protein LTR62_004951 [Meristemomyces frigidus]|uniref:Cyclase n=1 Tax=Meristemomyces frigidus TaxID=1508187 RepID=A0AAN7TQT8_9PEZI|nr:hypothetical protein LTR62_004951 [Meristemomyces frigidus]